MTELMESLNLSAPVEPRPPNTGYGGFFRSDVLLLVIAVCFAACCCRRPTQCRMCGALFRVLGIRSSHFSPQGSPRDRPSEDEIETDISVDELIGRLGILGRCAVDS